MQNDHVELLVIEPKPPPVALDERDGTDPLRELARPREQNRRGIDTDHLPIPGHAASIRATAPVPQPTSRTRASFEGARSAR